MDKRKVLSYTVYYGFSRKIAEKGDIRDQNLDTETASKLLRARFPKDKGYKILFVTEPIK